MILIFLGAPGSGKGTQATMTAEKYRLPQICTGDILREAVQRKEPLGLKAVDYMTAGKLVPDDLVIDLIEQRIERANCKQGFLLDGFPRTIEQAQRLEKVLKQRDRALSGIFYIKVDEEQLIHRLTGRRICPQCSKLYHIEFNPPKKDELCDICHIPVVQRKDDSPEVVLSRLEVYRQKTEPLVKYYQKKAVLIPIEGNGKVDEIFREISQKIDGFLPGN